jgi:hypothetical protein
MVKIQKRLVKKRYYGKAEYQYPVYSLNVPKKYHELVLPFLNQDLNLEVRREEGVLVITLIPLACRG